MIDAFVVEDISMMKRHKIENRHACRHKDIYVWDVCVFGLSLRIYKYNSIKNCKNVVVVAIG